MSRSPLRRLASAAAAPLLLAGCAAQVLDAPPPAPRAEAATRPGRPGFVIAAPHAASDGHTAAIAAEVARRTGFGLLVASSADAVCTRRLHEIAQGPVRFCAEIHGRHGIEPSGPIEIATVGIDRELGQRLRALAELVRDAHLRGQPAAPRLEVVVAPTERLGAPGAPERALHIALPSTARDEHRVLYTAILADFVAQAVAVPPGR
jgi:hypothetical protein